MNVLDLFSGIGGFSLGLERAGMRTVGFCEIHDFCQRIIRRHWPQTPLVGDVCSLDAEQIAALGPIDVVCGGFPCQDVSDAGPRAGLAGLRSGLYRELIRAIRMVRPLYAIVENVAALLNRGMGTFLGDMAEIGYDAEWHCIPACSLGAPHERDRVWIVANPTSERWRERWTGGFADGLSWLSNAPRWDTANPDRQPAQRPTVSWQERFYWPDEPALLGVDDGVPFRMDRVGALGNAVVPQIPEIIGRAIMNTIAIKAVDQGK